MAFNAFGYNPFQSPSYGGMPKYGTPAYAPQAYYPMPPVRFYGDNTAYGVNAYGQRPYGAPAYASTTWNRAAAPQQPIIYVMQPPPAPQKDTWNWKKMLFSSVSTALGIVLAGVAAIELFPRPFSIALVNAMGKRANEPGFKESLIDWLSGVTRGTLAQTLDEPTVRMLQGKMSDIFSKDFIAQKIDEATEPMTGMVRGVMSDEATKVALTDMLADVANRATLTDALRTQLDRTLSPTLLAKKMREMHQPLKETAQALARDPELKGTLRDELTDILKQTMGETLDEPTLHMLQGKIEGVLTPEFIEGRLTAAHEPIKQEAMRLMGDPVLKTKISGEISTLLQETVQQTLTPDFVRRLGENGQLTGTAQEQMAKVVQGTVETVISSADFQQNARTAVRQTFLNGEFLGEAAGEASPLVDAIVQPLLDRLNTPDVQAQIAAKAREALKAAMKEVPGLRWFA